MRRRRAAATVAVPDGDAAVAVRVAAQRHEEDVVAEDGDGVEPEPLVAACSVPDPLRSVGPLRGE